MTSAFEQVNKQAVASAFSRAAVGYDAAAVLQRDVGEGRSTGASNCSMPAVAPVFSAAAGVNWASR